MAASHQENTTGDLPPVPLPISGKGPYAGRTVCTQSLVGASRLDNHCHDSVVYWCEWGPILQPILPACSRARPCPSDRDCHYNPTSGNRPRKRPLCQARIHKFHKSPPQYFRYNPSHYPRSILIHESPQFTTSNTVRTSPNRSKYPDSDNQSTPPSSRHAENLVADHERQKI